MKKLTIIGASYLQRPLVEKCRELGIYSICFAWEEGAEVIKDPDLLDEMKETVTSLTLTHPELNV